MKNIPLKLKHQVNYGPKEGLTPDDQQNLQTHYGNAQALQRLTQYSKKHKTFVEAAEAAGRPLTEQEEKAKSTKKNAPDASINHIIASGTGQNILNRETLRFNEGVNSFKKRKPNQVSGIAKQAAAVGRVQGYNRAIINERYREPLSSRSKSNRKIYGNEQVSTGSLNPTITRNRALKHTLTAFQSNNPKDRNAAYRNVLKMSFDSPGNLRVGNDYGNNIASTGFDAPLNHNAEPTERANRLLAAHQAYAPDDLLRKDRLFTLDSNNNRISSSQSIQGRPSKRKKTS